MTDEWPGAETQHAVVPTVTTAEFKPSAPATARPAAARKPPDPLKFNKPGWWAAVIVLLAAAAAFSVLVALGSAFDHAHRLAASLTALLDVAALAVLAHVILVTYQSGATGILKVDPAQPDADAKKTLAFRSRGLKGAVIGQDGRASTSKTQVVLWTGALVWAFVDLLLLARAHPGGNLFTAAVTGNWHPEYLVLLGLPVAAAATAKAVVSGSNGGQGPITKSDLDQMQGSQTQGSQPGRVYVRNPVSSGVKGFAAGVAELITADDDTVAWSDLQYVAFTLITLVYFAAQFLSQPQNGLPAVPAALLTLMGVSASGYTAKKIVDAQGSVPD